MAYEEISGGNGGNDDREFVSAKIGAEFEGIFRGMSNPMPSQYGGEYRVTSIDTLDGRKIAVRATKILLERLEAAGLTDGDKLKIRVEEATTKDGKRTYANPRLFVDRSGGGAPAPAPKPAPARTRVQDDEPPF